MILYYELTKLILFFKIIVITIYMLIIFKFKFKTFCNYKSGKLLGIHCDCGDWGGTEDIE